MTPELVRLCQVSLLFNDGISDRCGVLLEVEWEEYYCRHQEERLDSVYNKANILGLHTFLGGYICNMGKQ
jgi:hypothetical protein